MAEKYLWKSSIFRNAAGCNNFSHIFKNMYFLCDAIALQLVEGTPKVLGKSLKTALAEAHFIVSLYSFHLPPVSYSNPSLPKVSHFPPSQAEQLTKLLLL